MIKGATFYSSFLSHVCYPEEAEDFDNFVSDHFLNKSESLRGLIDKLARIVEESLKPVKKERQYSKILGDWWRKIEKAEPGVEFPVIGTFPTVAGLFNDALLEKAVIAEKVRGIVEKICVVFIDNLTEKEIKNWRLVESLKQYEFQLRGSGQ